MSKQPPEDDTLFEAIFSQLQDAMSDTEYGEDGQVQEELLEGIRHSLEALFGGLSATERPTVTVVDGGKSDDSPRDDQDRPKLAFAPDVETSEQDSGHLPDLSDVQVRILKGTDLFPNPQPNEPSLNGKIALDDEHPQTVFKGTSDRTYRIFCRQGRLFVHCLEEKLVLRQGQSIDVECSEIAVSSNETATGHYFRVAE